MSSPSSSSPTSPLLVGSRPRQQQPSGLTTIFRPTILIFCSLVLIAFIFINSKNKSHLDFEDAVFLTKNSIKELREQYFADGFHPRRRIKLHNEVGQDSQVLNSDIDYPLNNVVNSFFPIDAVVSFNASLPEDDPSDNITTHDFIARYASFSPILNYRMSSKYKVLRENACSKLKGRDLKEYKNKTLIVLRGECTFVDKVSNLLESNLNPKSIIIANDEPYRGLITMFSSDFNQDGSLRIPILFITNEDYHTLKAIEKLGLEIDIDTAYIGSWLSILLSMVLSPPLLIVIFYCIIICGQRIRKRQVNIQNKNMVKQLPIYIYNIDHLIASQFFQKYLTTTSQTNMVPKDSEAMELFDSPKGSIQGASSRIIVGGVDVRASKDSLHVITAPDDFFPAYKCSICLDKYVPLKSKVLVLECKHFFHEKCLSNWLINFKRSCPLCNSTLHKPNNAYLLADDQEYYGSMDLEAGFDASPSQQESITSEGDEEDFYMAASSPRSGLILNTSNEPVERFSSSESGDSTQESKPKTSTADSETFFTAHQQLPEVRPYTPDHLKVPPAEGSSRPSSIRSPRSYLISRPSQILSRLSTAAPSDEADLSVSIDSDEFVAPIEGSTRDVDRNTL
ncbi:uncharacterized protein SPAPADRAFT_134915 [Spathaspora passalidarum NRRL Y-27907]|uniref:RING-type domain-containing protein n=1 Tax=Spathaspora passalidarum (strain NRRL Y-27907 / 11-Y1) TaxID=619300 RepID=G3AHH9_SPAPN|nr:uncharacterized protein SPAPADRAFT_134915 [Spathaspora passalidarum NRRL Y-27907]EGW34143.1 hypothetical protein SPAPADRAFT_134915 [Spathaspora passalidarum NRRL Y-27907]